MELLVDGSHYRTYNLKDTPDNQDIEIDSISPKTSGAPVELSFKILKVYPGAKYNDVSIENAATLVEMAHHGGYKVVWISNQQKSDLIGIVAETADAVTVKFAEGEAVFAHSWTTTG